MYLKVLIVFCIFVNFGIGAKLNDTFRKRFPYKIDGVTLEGGPILLVPYGEWDIAKALQNGEGDTLRELYHEIFDKLANLSIQDKGAGIKSGVSIFDMSKYSVIQGFNPQANAFMIEMTTYFDTKYDYRILKRWYLINTPPAFTMGYNLLKLFLPERIQVKWRVYSVVRYYWQIALFQDVSPEQLPQQYGGIRDVPGEIAVTELEDVVTVDQTEVTDDDSN